MAENFSHFEEIIKNKFDFDSEATNRFTWYDVLGLPLYGAYDDNKRRDLNSYLRTEFRGEEATKASKCLSKAVNILNNEGAKKAYDEKLKEAFLARLEELASTLSEKNTLTKTNVEKIVEQGRKWKVEASKIEEITGKYTVIEANGGSGDNVIPKGTPIVELINTATNQPQEEIIFADVKLSSRTTQTFTVKNGGGGYLNATIKTSSESWIQVSSNKIEQKDLPKNINITIAPSAEKNIEGGAIYDNEYIEFSYKDGNGRKQTKRIRIEVTTEGYEKTAKRKSLWAVGIYFLVYLGGNTYLPHLSGLDFIYWWTAAFVLWKAANWFFRWKPLNKPMVLLLPLMFIAGMYFGLKAASKPKDADLKIIPINKIGYMKRKEGVIVLDYPESGKELHRLPYSIPISITGKDSISGWYKMVYGTEDEVQHGYIPNNSITFDSAEVRVDKKKKNNSVKAKRERIKSNLDSTRKVVSESDSI